MEDHYVQPSSTARQRYAAGAKTMPSGAQANSNAGVMGSGSASNNMNAPNMGAMPYMSAKQNMGVSPMASANSGLMPEMMNKPNSGVSPMNMGMMPQQAAKPNMGVSPMANANSGMMPEMMNKPNSGVSPMNMGMMPQQAAKPNMGVSPMASANSGMMPEMMNKPNSGVSPMNMGMMPQQTAKPNMGVSPYMTGKQNVSGAMTDTSPCGYKNGELPPCAPLSVGYVPFQSKNPPTYQNDEALTRGTLFPGLDLPFMNIANNTNPYAGTPLGELMALGFAIDELNLYLDTHSNDRDALDMLKTLNKLMKEGMDKYVQLYGPQTIMDITSGDEFTWLNNPWPWEYAERGAGK